METEKQQDSNMMEDNNVEEILEPKVGTLYNSIDEAFQCYNSYGMSNGFGVVTKSSRTDGKGNKCHIVYACHKSGKNRSEGVNPVKPSLTTKTNCKAQICLSSKVDGKWMLNSFILEHNHEMLEPEKTKYLNCNRFIPLHAKRIFERNASAGIRINKTMTSCVIEAGGPDNLSYTERDMRNLMNRVKRLDLKEGDAEAMMKYFRKMQKDNNNFFYTIDVDENNRLKNVFWADARSREAYKEFGDVITFDTTYLVNKFDMPFTPFVGVNHHGYCILFGCGLVTREDTDSFIWLFKAWLECMFDIAPNAIITDQCKAMQNAISIVFPNARHRWCLWHIMKKIPEKFKAYGQYKAIKFNLKIAVYDTLNSNEFDETWGKLIKEYNLEDHEWLSGLYKERNRWVPAIVKDTFWAGMSTTQRSESINAFFDGYVKRSTSLKEFVEQYDNALSKKVQKEEEEDFRCLNTKLGRISPFQFEDQFSAVYTLEKYQQFQEQFREKIRCNLTVGPVVNGISEFFIKHEMMVGNKHSRSKTFIFTAHYNDESSETKCNCRMFESKGMVCAHMMSVWAHKMLRKIPDKYILKRWQKNLVRSHTNVKISYVNWEKKPELQRFDKMECVYRKAADMAMFSDAKTDIIVAKMIEAIKIVEKMDERECIRNEPISEKGDVCRQPIVGDPVKTSRVGKPRSKRMESNIEKYAKKISKKRSKSGQHDNIDIENDPTECYRPLLSQESLNIYQSQTSENLNDTSELDDCLFPWHFLS